MASRPAQQPADGGTGSFRVVASGEFDLPVILRSDVDALIHEEADVSLYTTISGVFLGGALGGVITMLSGILEPVPVYIAVAVCVAVGIAFGVLSIRERRQRKTAREKIDNTPFRLQLGWVPATSPPPTGTSGNITPANEPQTATVESSPLTIPNAPASDAQTAEPQPDVAPDDGSAPEDLDL